MSLQRIVIDTGSATANDFKSKCDLAPLGLPGLQSLENFIGSIPNQNRSLLEVKVGAVQATATIVSTLTAVNNETMSLLNQTITAKTSGAVPANGEFNISGTPTTQATSIALAINSMSSLTGKVTATSSVGTVTVTAVVPGLIGNGLQISESLSGVTVTQFTGGTDGTAYTLDLR
jgi:hypothetical protein